MTCEKVKYETYKLARDAVKNIAKRERTEMRSYKCDACGLFHLTSIKKKNLRLITHDQLNLDTGNKLDKEIKEAAKQIPLIPQPVYQYKKGSKNTFKISEAIKFKNNNGKDL